MACLEPYIRKNEDPNELLSLTELIAEGSFGTVYKGTHSNTGNVLAVKIIQLEEDETFDDLVIEIDILSRCSHPNIVGYFGSWRKGDELFIGMELCDGGSCSDIYQILNEPFGEQEICYVCHETLQGLSYLHDMGVIHRDIKGANILFNSAGECKLVDFGVSGQISAHTPTRKTFIGTPYWMAPEVIENKGQPVPYDQRADVWSLGITLLELAHGEPPLAEIHPMKALFQIPYRKPPTLMRPGLWSPQFGDFIGKCLQKDPRYRASVSQLLQHPWLSLRPSKDTVVYLIKRYLMAKADEDAAEAETKEEEADEQETRAQELLEMVASSEKDEREHAVGKGDKYRLAEGRHSRTQLSESAKEPVAATPARHAPPAVATPIPEPLGSPKPGRPVVSSVVPRSRPKTVHKTAAKRTSAIKQVINKKLLKQQLQQIKRQQQQQNKELEQLEIKQNTEKMRVNKIFNEKLQREQQRHQREEEQLNRKQAGERDAEGRHIKSDSDSLQKSLQQLVKTWHKENSSLQKLQQREFSSRMSVLEKDWKEEIKLEQRRLDDSRGRGHSKSLLKQRKLRNKIFVMQRVDEANIAFQHVQQLDKMNDEHHLRRLEKNKMISQAFDHQARKINFEMQQLAQNHQRSRQAAHEEQEVQYEWLTQAEQYELEALRQKHALLESQLQARLLVERDQHRRQQQLESRELHRLHKAQQKKKMENFQESLKAEMQKPSRHHSKKELRKRMDVKKDRIEKEIKYAEEEYHKENLQRNAEEDVMLREHQEQQQFRQHDQHTQEMEELKKKHTEGNSKLVQEQVKQNEMLEVKIMKEKIQLLRQLHADNMRALYSLRENRRRVLTNFEAKEKRKQSECHKEEIDLLLRHCQQKEQLADDMYQMEREHEEKAAKKKGSQSEERIVAAQKLYEREKAEMRRNHTHLQQLLLEDHAEQHHTLANIHRMGLEKETEETTSMLSNLEKKQSEEMSKLMAEVSFALEKHTIFKNLE